MNLQLDMNDETNTVTEDMQSLVSNLLAHALQEEGLDGEIEISLTFMSDEDIQAINYEYRNINTPTDVISFALEEMGEGEVKIIAEDMPTFLGDILISIPTAERQAEEYNHSLEREIGFLAVHGLLHLLGYDHLTETEEKEMFQRQEDILKSFGLER